MAVITLWMGVSSPFFTRRFAASSQNVLDQMQRQFPQEAKVPPPAERNGHANVAAADFRGRLSSGHDFSRAVRSAKLPASAAEGIALPAQNKIVIPLAPSF